jgi:hypothetical protein
MVATLFNLGSFITTTYSRKKKLLKDLKFCAQVTVLDLHQMEYSCHVKQSQWSPFNAKIVHCEIVWKISKLIHKHLLLTH